MSEEYVGRKFRTVFVGADRPDDAVVGQLRAVGMRLNELGLTPENAGNFSVRKGGGMLITSGGVNKGELTADDVVEVVDFDFHTAKAVGVKEPSSETPMHWLIYHCYPMTDAIIHVHDPLAVNNADKLKLACGIHSTREVAHYGTEDQAYRVIEALEHSQYAVIKGHGVVCIGQTLKECQDLIVKIHESLKRKCR